MSDTTTPSPYNPPHSQKSNLPVLYYGLFVIGTAAVVLAVYNLIIIKWCAHQHQNRQHQSSALLLRRRRNRSVEVTAATQQSTSCQVNSNLLMSFQYKKDIHLDECAVCLSVFEEGEEVKKLPGCIHSFHASCIDMWLFSHSDCPLCRAPVDPSSSLYHLQQTLPITPQNSQQNLLHSLPLS